MLDDVVMIHERDAQDALGIAEKQWQQLLVDFDIEKMSTKRHFLHYLLPKKWALRL